MRSTLAVVALLALLAFSIAQIDAQSRFLERLRGLKLRRVSREGLDRYPFPIKAAKFAEVAQDEEAPEQPAAPVMPIKKKKKSIWKKIGHTLGRIGRQMGRNWLQQNTGIQVLQDEEAPEQPAAPVMPIRKKKKSIWKKIGHTLGRIGRQFGRNWLQQNTGIQVLQDEVPEETAAPVPAPKKKKKSIWKKIGHSFGQLFRDFGRKLIQQQTGVQLSDDFVPRNQTSTRRPRPSRRASRRPRPSRRSSRRPRPSRRASRRPRPSRRASRRPRPTRRSSRRPRPSRRASRRPRPTRRSSRRPSSRRPRPSRRASRRPRPSRRASRRPRPSRRSSRRPRPSRRASRRPRPSRRSSRRPRPSRRASRRPRPSNKPQSDQDWLKFLPVLDWNKVSIRCTAECAKYNFSLRQGPAPQGCDCDRIAAKN